MAGSSVAAPGCAPLPQASAVARGPPVLWLAPPAHTTTGPSAGAVAPRLARCTVAPGALYGGGEPAPGRGQCRAGWTGRGLLDRAAGRWSDHHAGPDRPPRYYSGPVAG